MKRNFTVLILIFVLCNNWGLTNSFSDEVCPLDSLKPRKVSDLRNFARLPVLNQGRIKPMESYAQSILLQFSGKSRVGKESAMEWFSRFLFAPRATYDDKIFLINNPEIAEAIKIEPEKHRRYSYHQIEKGYEKLHALALVADQMDPKNQSVVDKEIIRVISNFQLYVNLSGAFAFAFPHPDFTIDDPGTISALDLPKDRNQFSFYDIIVRADLLSKATEALETKKQTEWTQTEQRLMGILNALYFWTEHYADCPLGIIPSKSLDNEQWFSPMDIIISNFGDEVYRSEVKVLRDMTIHYWNAEQLAFDVSVRSFNDSLTKRVSPKERKALDKFSKEMIYNKLNLFLYAKLFYGLAFMVFLFSLLSNKKWFHSFAWGLILAGFIPHVSAMVLRIIIMSRPPVSNLYETFIFVALIGAILGIILEVVNKNWLGIVVSSVCGLVFLLISSKFASEGDTMQMLIAVLNSNFWLGTHVLSITIGYAGCCVAGVMGHVYILQALFQTKDKKKLETTFKNMLGILGFGLTMTFLGTMLGGIWADQSWGRFWGWDPKENGALMIVIWSAIIFHAKIARIINALGVAVGCVLGLLVVMWAWFGVNLLSVGLHSYGFTSGVANSLAAYVILEFVFLAISIPLLGKKGIKI